MPYLRHHREGWAHMCMLYSHIETLCFNVWIPLLRKETHIKNTCILWSHRSKLASLWKIKILILILIHMNDWSMKLWKGVTKECEYILCTQVHALHVDSWGWYLNNIVFYVSFSLNHFFHSRSITFAMILCTKCQLRLLSTYILFTITMTLIV